MDVLALTFSSGWASGINSYLVVLVLGLADRFGSVDGVPDALGRWDVLAVAGFLYSMEFIADKIPLIDSTWDVISTAIRPTAGAVIGGVSPIDHPAPIRTWIDPWLRQHPVVWAAAGHPAAVFSTTYDELVEMTGAVEVQVD